MFFVKILTKLYIMHNDGAIFKDFLCKITDEECEQTHSPPTNKSSVLYYNTGIYFKISPKNQKVKYQPN